MRLESEARPQLAMLNYFVKQSTASACDCLSFSKKRIRVCACSSFLTLDKERDLGHYSLVEMAEDSYTKRRRKQLTKSNSLAGAASMEGSNPIQQGVVGKNILRRSEFNKVSYFMQEGWLAFA